MGVQRNRGSGGEADNGGRGGNEGELCLRPPHPFGGGIGKKVDGRPRGGRSSGDGMRECKRCGIGGARGERSGEHANGGNRGAAGEKMAKPNQGAIDALAGGLFRNALGLTHLFQRQAFEIAQRQRIPIGRGKAGQRFVEVRREFFPLRFGGDGLLRPRFHGLPFVEIPPQRRCAAHRGMRSAWPLISQPASGPLIVPALRSGKQNEDRLRHILSKRGIGELAACGRIDEVDVLAHDLGVGVGGFIAKVAAARGAGRP